MMEWWTSLGLEQQVYYAIAIGATVLLVAQTLLLLIGGADELADAGDFDMDDASEHPSGIHVLSTRTIVAFLFGSGWTGVIVSAGRLAQPETTALGAVTVGVLFAGVLFYLMRLLYSLRDSGGALDYQNAVGEVGTVYLPIPAGMAGSGRIQVVVQGRLKVIQALTHHRERIENRARVRVVDLLDDNTLVVEPLAEAGAHQED